MDSVNVIIDSGSQALNYLMPQVMALIILPLMALAKKTVVTNYIPAELIAAIVAIGSAFGLATVFAPTLEPFAIIKFALESLGSSTVMYGTIRIGQKYQDKQKSQPIQ